MVDWDTNSEQLSHNLNAALSNARNAAFKRVIPTIETAKSWHKTIMHKLTVPSSIYVARYRGEEGLEKCNVEIGGTLGVPPAQVKDELKKFEMTLQKALAILDKDIPKQKELTADDLAAVIDLCAWAHAEWVRIHPFANGNGRTARIWANFIVMRYGIPPFVTLRPRPKKGYALAAIDAMYGKWDTTATVFRSMYIDYIRSAP